MEEQLQQLVDKYQMEVIKIEDILKDLERGYQAKRSSKIRDMIRFLNAKKLTLSEVISDLLLKGK